MDRFKEPILLGAMIFVTVSMINELSVIGLVLWIIGIALTFTLLDRKGLGISLMSHTKRRILLGVGMTLTLCSLINEISLSALLVFMVGFVLTISMIEIQNSK